MSRNSFPRPEHAAILRQQIEPWLRLRAPSASLAELGLNHYRCFYRLGIRLAPDQEWSPVQIHFQVAERLLAGGSPDELNKILDSFWGKTFGAVPSEGSETMTG